MPNVVTRTVLSSDTLKALHQLPSKYLLLKRLTDESSLPFNKPTPYTKVVWPRIVLRHVPVFMSQIFTDVS